MSDRPTSCPHCGSKPSSVFWNVFECETSVNKRGDKITRTSLCREREAHNNTKTERDEAQYKLEDARQSLEVAMEDLSEAKRERDEARAKVERQAERIRKLESATNHAGGLNK